MNIVKYNELKAEHPDKVILLLELGFYKSYFDDAKKIAGVLNTPLIRQAGSEIHTTGFPCYESKKYFPKLTRAGLTLVIWEPQI